MDGIQIIHAQHLTTPLITSQVWELHLELTALIRKQTDVSN